MAGGQHTGVEPVPETFGKYTLVRKLASGGMGEIILATQQGPDGFERHVAIKRILPQVSANREFVTMFLDEARLVANFNHPNIVQIFDFGKEQGTYYLAMEFIQGASLHHLMRRCKSESQTIPITHTVKIVSQACQGLEYAHNYTAKDGTPLNLIHRDVSPHNLMLTYDGMVKLLDFGVAKAESNVYQTQAASLKGKVAYMSPEQIRTPGKLDRRSDLFSLGIVMYKMLTLKAPFPGESEYDFMEAIVNRKPVDPRELNRDTPDRLAEIVMRTLEKKPSKRYPTARELMTDLEQLLLDQRQVVNTYSLGRFLGELVPRQTLSPDPPSLAPQDDDRDTAPNQAVDESSSGRASNKQTEPIRPRSPDRRPWVAGLLTSLVFLGAAALGLVLIDPFGAEAPPPLVSQAGPEPPAQDEDSKFATDGQKPPDQARTVPEPKPAKSKPRPKKHKPKPRYKLPDAPLLKIDYRSWMTGKDADQLATDALEAQRNGRHKQAISLYRKAIRKNPKDHELARMLANVYAKTGARDEAILYYKRYLNSCPGCPFVSDVRTYLSKLEAEQKAPVSRIQWPSQKKDDPDQPHDLSDQSKLNDTLREARELMKQVPR